MKRYHVKVYIPDNDKIRLDVITKSMRFMPWRYTSHTLDGLKYRSIRPEDVLLFIKKMTLDAGNIFEYYTDDAGHIVKMCYRIKYTAGTDLIIVVSHKKEIITIYLNESIDNHITLNKELYDKA